MPRWRALVLTLALVPVAQAQISADNALATMQVGEGLQVSLFAAEPQLVNPTAIDVDHKGRVWVAEAVNYRRLNFRRPLLRDAGDRIMVLTDTDGDGRADKSEVFYQGNELYGPLSVLVLPQTDGKAVRVLVAQSPDILEFWDKDGDNKADGPPTKWLSGFGGYDHDHGVHGLTTGPDGKLYFTVGDEGVNGLQGKDGKGRTWTTSRDPKSDCQAGTVWRCNLDGTNLELIAHNFRNNYEACVDSFGEIWLSDNDDDGNEQTRICHVYPGGNYGFWPRGSGQTHWHEEQPGVVHKTLRTGFGSPTGICFYEGRLLPEKFRGGLIHADAGPREIRCFHRKPKGAGYTLDKTLMLTSSDAWFRPSDVCVAPDGSVFVADWYDPGVGGHGMGDHTRGRIYRLTPTGRTGYKVPVFATDTPEGIAAAILSPNKATTTVPAAQDFADRPKLYFDAILRILGTVDDIEIARMLTSMTGHERLADKQREFFDDRAKQKGRPTFDRVERQSRFAAMQLRVGPPTNPDVLAGIAFATAKAETDRERPDMAVLREAALVLRNANVPNARRILSPLTKLYDGSDIFYRAALNIACGTDPARRDAILTDFDNWFPEWNDKVADLAWELRPKSVLARLDKLLADPKLTATQKARIVDLLAVDADPVAGRTMLSLLSADHPTEVRTKALSNLRLFLPTKWKSLTNGTVLKTTIEQLLGDSKSVPMGLELVAAAGHVAAIDRVAELAATNRDAVRTLGKLRDPKAVAALVNLPVSAESVTALGELAAGSNGTLVVNNAVAALQKLVTAGDHKAVALTALAGSRAGTGYLLKLKESGQFPPDLLAQAGLLLRNSPFQGERNKAMQLFPVAAGLDPKSLPSVAELARKSGDVARGKALMARSKTSETQCLKCHTIHKDGGQIGPDLSQIGKKGSVENLLESILSPSKAIADQFVTWTITTVDGQTLNGLLVSESESTVTLRDANGKDYPISVKDVEKRTKSLVSLMPEDIIRALTEQDLLDLVAYLATLKD